MWAGNISTHGSLQGFERCPCAVRYESTCFNTIIDVLILVQVWRFGQWWGGIVIIKATHAERPGRILLFDGILSRWTNLSTLSARTPHTGTIMDVSVVALLVRRHVWLEGTNRTFCNGWNLENEEPK